MTKLIPKKQTAWGKLEYNGPQYSQVVELMKKEEPQAYNRLLVANARSLQPNSEIVRWKDANDKEQTSTTNIGMSGTDPIGVAYVGDVLLSPAFKLAGRGVQWGLTKTGWKHFNKENLILHLFDQTIFSQLPKNIPNIPSRIIRTQSKKLVEVEPGIFSNHPLKNSMRYHRLRLNNGGFLKLFDNGDKVASNSRLIINNIDKKGLNKFLLLTKEAPFSIQKKTDLFYSKQGPFAYRNSNNVFLPKGYLNELKFTTKTKDDMLGSLANTLSHEYDHALHTPAEPILDEWNPYFLYNRPYFRKGNNTELSARGTLLKNYYGIIDPNLPITLKMLEYASKHYIDDTGINNNMKEFFENISDFESAAKWLSKYSSAIVAPVGSSLIPKNKNTQPSN